MNKNIINIPDKGTTLIEASAGTGKTYTLAEIYVRLIIEKKFTVDNILVVTFTNAAVKELKSRIRKRLTQMDNYNPQEKILLENAARDFDKSAIFTIHGFCLRILEENAFESGSLYNTRLETDTDDYYKNIVNDFWRKNFTNLPETVIMHLKNNYMERLQKLLKSAETGYDSLRAGIKTRDEIFFNESKIIIAHKKLLESFKIIKEYWNKEDLNKKIIEIVSDKRLNQTSYKRIDTYIKQMNLFLKSKQPGMRLFDQFDRFTQTKLTSSITKNNEFNTENPFFILCDDFKKKFDELDLLCSNYLTGIEYRFPEFIKTESARIKEKNNILFYNDLIDRTSKALKKISGMKFAEKIRSEFKAALIDEFQDTDRRQYEIFKNIFGDKSILFLIGDPKQSIYGFRGADVFTYIEAVKTAANKETLQKNWRSEEELVNSVNSVFERIKYPFIFPEIPFHPVSTPNRNNSFFIEDKNGPLNVFFMTDSALKDAALNISTSREFADILIVDEISNILNLSEQGKAYKIESESEVKNKIKASDIAVLVKKNKNGLTVQNLLRERGVPSVIYATDSVFQSIEAEELFRIMKAVSTPSNINAIKSALATSIFGYSAEQITKEMTSEKGHAVLSEKFKRWKTVWENSGFISMIKKLLSEEKIKSRIIKFHGGERSITNIGHLAELINEAEENSKSNLDSSIKWLQEKILSNKNFDSNENQLRLETDENAVTIISIHKSKGLEYGIVFCPDLWDSSPENMFIKYHENSDTVLDIASDENSKNNSEYEALAEELRVIYVALTRARYRTYLTWGKIKKTYDSAAAYLFHSTSDFNPNEQKKRHDIISKDTENVNMISELKNIKGINVNVKNIQSETAGKIIRTHPIKKTEEEKKIFRDIDFSINNSFRILSYSTLVKNNSSEEKDHDIFFNTKETNSKSDISGSGIIQFPKGALSGIFFHEIFEESDFQDLESIKKTSLSKIQKYRISEDWISAAIETVKDILDLEIISGKNLFKLKQLGTASRLNELEFYFPLTKFNSIEFMEIINKFEKKIATAALPEINQTDGFIKGYIDLVAENNGRYYIFDWKTNHLGYSVEDYNKNSLKSAMDEGNYFLQAIIYSFALHRYLKSRINDYSYENHFGGTCYVFIRGVSGGSGSTFYYYKPEEDLINSLDLYLNGEAL